MEKPRLNNKTILLHPFIVFSSVWLTVTLLYSLHLSSLLLYPTSEVFKMMLFIWLPFAGIVGLYSVIHHLAKLAQQNRKVGRHKTDLNLLERRLSGWFRIWVVVSIVEIFVSGGIPIVWLIQHSTKTYVDFGISSLHGLVNSLLLSIATCRMALYIVTGQKRHLKIPLFIILWSVLVVTRQVMMTALAEYAVIFLSLRAVKTSSLMKLGLGCVALILIFGFIGDLRSGAEAFKELALPTKQYPDWLPSGVLWVYIYVTTPINNLLFTAHTFSPLNSLLIPNTAATLFPSVLRTAIYGNELGQAVSGNLVTAAFNVSTAYLGPFEDYGMFGIIMFSAFAALTSQYFWYRASLRDILIFAVLTQCLLFTLFYNLFLALPVIAQLFWLAYFFMPRFNFGSKTSAAPYAI